MQPWITTSRKVRKMKKTRSYEHHGETGTRLYKIWKNMKYRCSNPKWPPYKWYGAKGIKVCEEWEQSYTAFRDWALSNGYQDYLELDRIDPNGNYEPSNCRWVDHYKQTMNRKDTLYVTYDGITITLREFQKCFGLNKNSCNNWRYLNILEQKLHEKTGKKVVVTGGKKGHT